MSGSRGRVEVRRAEARDMSAVLAMIQELADFEKMSSGPELTVQDLIRDAGFDGGQEVFHCYIAELLCDETPTSTKKPVGYSICFFSYSTWQGKSYFMEDIYVKPDYRRLGVGETLLKEVARNAKVYGCKRLDFHVLGWNPARKFYERMGAEDLTETEEWHFCRLQGKSLDELGTE